MKKAKNSSLVYQGMSLCHQCGAYLWRNFPTFLCCFFVVIIFLFGLHLFRDVNEDGEANAAASTAEDIYILLLDDVTANETFIEMDRRKAAVRKVCKREGLGHYASVYTKPKVKYPPTPHFESYYFDRAHKLAWCPIYKSASTSWLYNFCLLGGLHEDEISSTKTQISKVARSVWPSLDYDDGLQAMEESRVKFFIVRHPFERLLSAYRDKLENKDKGLEHGTYFFYKKFGEKIVKKYRDQRQYDEKMWAKKNYVYPDEEAPRPEPTFEEFVRYLIDINLPSSADEHWLPFYFSCAPCSVEYDVIAKFETLERDQKFIINQAKLGGIIQPVWKHKTRGTESSALIKKYFSTISKYQGLRLYEKYRLDFEMFQYSIDDYKQYFHDD